MNTAQRLIDQVLGALRRDPDTAQAHCGEYLRDAIKDANLLRDYGEQLASDSLEFHVAREAGCAIKGFKFQASKEPSYPHDHAGFWGVYGILSGTMEMAYFEEEDTAAEDWPGLRELTRLSMPMGSTRLIRPDDIHAVWSECEGTVAIAIYNGDLNNSKRRIYDLKKKVRIRDRSQWQARRELGQEAGALRMLAPEEVKAEN